jgi:hypothetical protein
MRRLALLALLALPLVLPQAAAAKRIRSLTACGADACLTTHDRALLAAFTDVGPPSDPPSRPVPFYRVTMRIAGSSHAAASSWAPAAGRLLGEDGTWMAVRPAVGRGLEALTAGLSPRPAAALPGFPPAPRERGELSLAPFVAAAVAAAGLVLLLVLRLRRARPPARGPAAPPAAQAASSTGAAAAGRANR